MEASHQLKLADYSKSLTRAPGALYFERRCCERRRASGQVTALVTDRQTNKDYHRICSLQLRDQSNTGLGGFCDTPIKLGQRVTLYFPPHGPEHGFDLTGIVVRCEKTGERYDIGIALQQRLAA